MLAGTKNCWRFIWSEAIWNGKEGYNASSDPDEMIKGYEALPNKESLDIGHIGDMPLPLPGSGLLRNR